MKKYFYEFYIRCIIRIYYAIETLTGLENDLAVLVIIQDMYNLQASWEDK